MTAEAKPGMLRVTSEVIRAGQPRPYADTERVIRLMFEHVPYIGDREWKEFAVEESFARCAAQGLPLGYTEKVSKEVEWWSTRLDYFKPLDPQQRDNFGRVVEQGGTVRASVWEFRTITPFTD